MPSPHRSHWRLDPSVTYLNHGSFGAAPGAVLDRQLEWRSLMERNPMRFFQETYQPALDAARGVLAGFVGADPAAVVFVRNATTGVNAVLRSIEPELGPGDEIVVTDHGYNACTNAAAASAARTGADLVTAPVPFPIVSPEEARGAVLGAVTARTRLVIVDHVTSPTALVLPVEQIVAALEPDIPVLVDGAHAPGMVDLDLGSLGASWAVGNCHKWMGTPKGCGYLVAREDRRDGLRHAVIGHGYNAAWTQSGSSFHAQFDWVGTDDATAWLTVPEAITVMASMDEAGWTGVRAANRRLALAGRAVVCSALDIPVPAPDEMIGSMAAVPLPGGTEGAAPDPLTAVLRRQWSIEVPVTRPSHLPRLVRISAQRYNSIEEYERLAAALRAEL